ncbi:phage tail assembly chaperone [Mesorhizobium sp.]|uniref:phage tail assembly chaperone n=1 Tax=Mesorhizobium sp. TaxID=1871066 RepID=UPI0025D598BA|nr:phage tail assembly chaperone [Mesorhizobium sp.]
MPNKYRGEIEAELGCGRHTLVLTLGALAELESAFGADDLMALAERFGTGRLSARDLAHAIVAVRGHVPMPIDRTGLDDLMRRFPDKTMEKIHHGG